MKELMENYREEQLNELQALDAIYPEEMTVISNGGPVTFRIRVRNEDDDEEKGERFEVELSFTYTENYPDELPLMEVSEHSDNLSQEQMDELLDLLKEEGGNNLGMVMIFILVSFTTEWLNKKVDEVWLMRKKEVERRKQVIEEAEMKKFEGTKVTVESFLAWKTAFDIEMKSLNEKGKEVMREENINNRKLTGKELFLRDNSLNESDLLFLDDEEFNTGHVKVDESLFQKMDDLDVDDLDEY